ncbi:APC family permease [Aeoliella sp. ICT_H6.2]|uniref:APC family permease n=1 Tax=Aeoliella straminimaris TaxID=2954799 RepID=A0A9X2FBR5_9BACT|nr:APC family permease [Aeoliella straminimaris]MCO6045960.1 APC family permease [Aeoliella straminimaris]
MDGDSDKLGTLSTLSIGIGGMVGGGIFATTGLAVQLTKGAVPIAFIVAGVVALLTSYSYLKLTIAYPGEGGTVEFLNRGFGTGILTGASNILLCFSYMVLVAIYAYALGSYGASFFAPEQAQFWQHLFLSSAIVLLTILNVAGGSYVIRSENILNLTKMIILAMFVIVGFCTPMVWERLGPDHFVRPIAMVSGAMVVFFNYEGFELIANASGRIKDRRRALPVAYVGGVLLVIVFYVLITMVTLGHLSFDSTVSAGDHALAVVANRLMGLPGQTMIAVAAVLACGSAINATLYSAGPLTYTVARSGELPRELERKIRGLPLEGMFAFAIVALFLANFVPLNAISTMASAGFLFIFMAVNVANIRLARETQSRRWVSALGALACGAALIIMCLQIDENPHSRRQLWILVGMVAVSLLIEVTYRAYSGRSIHLVRRHHKKNRMSSHDNA